jgi:hypothetical protein
MLILTALRTSDFTRQYFSGQDSYEQIMSETCLTPQVNDITKSDIIVIIIL